MAPRILIARLSALGDVVCTLPAAVACKRTWPECHVTWAVDPRFAAIPEACDAVDQVIALKPSVRRLPRVAGEFDLAFDLQGLLKSGIIVGLARAKQRLGYHWQREGSWLFSSAVTPDPTSFHIVDQYVDVVRAAGAVADRAEFALTPDPDAVLSVRRKLKERGVSGRIVVLNPGAGWVTKRWPAGSFAAVSQNLVRRGFTPVLIGGKGAADRAAVEEVRAAGGEFCDLGGQTSVAELIGLIRLASAHVGGDTGSTHLAAALGIPAIGLYSITRPQRSCPYGQFDRCLYDPSGLDQIPPALVLQRLESILDVRNEKNLV